MPELRKTRRYKVTPASMSMLLRPELADDAEPARGKTKELPVKALRTEPATLGSAETAGAALKATIGHCRKLRGADQLHAVVRAYETNPQVALDPWMADFLTRNVFSKYAAHRRLRGAGRPSRLEVDPFLIVAMVRLLQRRFGGTRTDALRRLHELGVIEFERGEARYKQAMREPRFKAALLSRDNEAFEIEAENETELKQVLSRKQHPCT